MSTIKKILGSCLAVLMLAVQADLVVAGSIVRSSAPAVGLPVLSFADLGREDFTVRLIYEQVFVDFPTPGGQKIDRATLSLDMEHSPELLPQDSDVLIALNDEPVADIILTRENAARNTIEIELPVAALKPGENELLLRFNMRLVEDGCGDVNDPNLWATIFAQSTIAFEAQDSPSAADLSQFPSPFSTYAAAGIGPQVSIVLPPAPTDTELSVAAQIAASLGQAAAWKDPPLAAFTLDEPSEDRLAEDSLIAISTAGNNPITAPYPSGITLLPSTANAARLLLVVSGADGTELQAAASVLTTRSARSALSGTYQPPAAPEPQALPLKPSRATLAELGFETKKVRGIGLHDLYYPIDVPYNWKPTSEAAVEVHFTHGPGVGAASLMTAYINGFETASIRLDFRNDDEGRLVLQLSPRQLHPGRNWLHLVFDLHMPRENCRFRYFEEAWAEVSAEKSVVNLAHVVSTAPLDLHYFPAQLLVPEDLSAALIVLPDAPSETDLTAMVRIAAKLGTYSRTDSLGIKVTTAERFEPRATALNVIVLGTPDNNALLRQYDSGLPQPLSRSNGQLTPSAGRPVLPEELTGQAAYFEVISAPWSRSDSLVVLSATSPDLLMRLVDVLPTGGRRLKEEGSLAVVTQTGVTGFNFENLSGESLSAPNRLLVAGLFGAAFLLIIIVGVVVVRGQARRRQQEEDD